MRLVNNPHTYPLLASVYGISYSDFKCLPIDVFMTLISDWQMSVGLKSGTEVFNIASKNWEKIISSNFEKILPKTPDNFIKALKLAKERLGTDKVDFMEIFKSMKDINK